MPRGPPAELASQWADTSETNKGWFTHYPK